MKPILHVPPARLARDRDVAIAQAIRQLPGHHEEMYVRVGDSDRYVSGRHHEQQYEQQRTVRAVTARPQSAAVAVSQRAVHTARPQSAQQFRESISARIAAQTDRVLHASRAVAMAPRPATTRAVTGKGGPCTADCWCRSCVDRERAAAQKRAEREAEIQRDKDYAAWIREQARNEEERDRAKNRDGRAKAQADMAVNQEQARNRGIGLIGKREDMGYLMEGRREVTVDHAAREAYRRELEEQSLLKRDMAEWERKQQLDWERTQVATNTREEEYEREEARRRKLELQREQQAALRKQAAQSHETVERFQDSYDTFLKMDDGSIAAQKRAARARELQEEQLRLIREREAARLEEIRRARASEGQEAHLIESELERERREAHERKMRLASEMRISWEAQMAERDRTRRDDRRDGMETLTGLQIGGNEAERIYEVCCRCYGPMPDGYFRRK